MKCALSLAFIALTTTTKVALAQPFVEPTFYVWGNHLPADIAPGTFPAMINMINVDAYGHGMPDQGTPASQTPSPETAAQRAATEIIARLYAQSYTDSGGMFHDHSVSDLLPHQICLTFFGLGRDKADCDGNQTVSCTRKADLSLIPAIFLADRGIVVHG